MIRLRPNRTYRFTICGNHKAITRDPPPRIRDRRPRERFIFPIMPDDSIFFDEIEVGKWMAGKMFEAMIGGKFKWGWPRFEIKVNDPSLGISNYYEIRPLDWEYIPIGSGSVECDCC